MKINDDSDGPRGGTTTRRNVLLTLAAAGGLAVVPPTAGGTTGAAEDDAAGDADVRRLALTDERRTVTHGGGFDDPVTVATPLSYDGSDEASTRVDRVRADGFDVAVEEWPFLDGSHVEESVGSITVGAGITRFDGGPRVAAGTVRAGPEWVRTTFDEAFSERPVVLTGTQTRNSDRPVVTRNRNVSTDGVSVRLRGEERTPADTPETVGFVALERGTGTLAGEPFEAGTVTGVDEEWHTVEFEGRYEDPVFLADVQTSDGPNTATLRYRNLRGTAVEVFVEEERSKDEETRHAEETVGYAVVESGTDAVDPPTGEPGTDGYGTGEYGVGRIGA